MLGLASALTTASSTSEQLYGLYLDGTGDYLDTGHTFQTTIRADFSWSLWVKPDDGQPGSNDILMGTQNSSSEDIFYFGIDTDGKIFVQHKANNDPASYTTDSAIFRKGACNWAHVVVTADYTDGGAATAYKIFVNGIEVSATLVNAVSEANHELFTTTDNFYIGGQNNDGSVANAFAGSIDEVAIFNTVLDADAVAAVYNSGKPFNLNNDKGNYDNSSALQGYWRMGNGPFDDIASGVVHDAHNPGYGSELVSEPHFVTDFTDEADSDWDVVNQDAYNTITASDGVLTIAWGQGGTAADVYIQDNILTVGKTYKVSINIVEVSNLADKGLRVHNGGTDYRFPDTIGSHDITFVATNTYFLLARNDANGIIKINQLSIKQLNGYPGLTAADASFSADTPDDQAMSNVMTLDGTGDYLNLSDVLDKGTSDFSVSFWTKVTHDDIDDQPFISKKEDDDNYWRIRIVDSGQASAGKIYVVGKGGGTTAFAMTGGAVMDSFLNTWVHICVTIDRDGNGVIYVNGVTTTYGSTTDISSSSSVNIDNTADLTIGSFSSNYVEGLMDEVAIWNVALDTAAVASIYGELYTGTSGDDANWVVYGTNTKAEDDDAVKITHGGAGGAGNANSLKLKAADGEFSTDLTVGATYKLEFDAKVDTGMARMKWYNASNPVISADITGTDYNRYTIYNVAAHATTDQLETTALSAGESIWIKNISLVKVGEQRKANLTEDFGNYDNASDLVGYWRMGDGTDDDVTNGIIHDQNNPGYGADLITNGTFDTDSDWTKETGWTISGGVASHSSGANAMLYQTSILTVGKTYKITYDITSYTSGNINVYTGNWGTNRSAVGSYTEYLVAKYTWLKFNASSANDFVGSIDNVVCKELNGYPGLTAADAAMIKQPI